MSCDSGKPGVMEQILQIPADSSKLGSPAPLLEKAAWMAKAFRDGCWDWGSRTEGWWHIETPNKAPGGSENMHWRAVDAPGLPRYGLKYFWVLGNVKVFEEAATLVDTSWVCHVRQDS